MAFYDAQNFGERIALIDDSGRSRSYRDLAALGDRLLAPVPSRSLMFLLGSNRAEPIAVYLAALRRGVVPVLLSSTLAEPLLRPLLAAYEPEYLFLPDERSELIAATGTPTACADGWTLLRRNTGHQPPFHSNLAAMLATSGSTGSPKMVRLSLENLRSNAQSIAEALPMRPDDRAITTLPMNYSYGLSILNSHFLIGATILLTDASLMEKRFWNFFRQQQPNTFGGVPYLYEMLEKLRFDRLRTDSLRYMTQAGGRLAPESLAKMSSICAAKKIEFYVMYGQTEATARMSVLPSNALAEHGASIGKPIKEGKFWLENQAGEKIDKINKIGELIYSGPNVALGYAECRADLAEGDHWNGRLRTGDLATFDAQGFYSVVGRKKRFVKIYGHRVSLDEVERLLADEGIECACVGSDDHLRVYTTAAERTAAIPLWLAERTGLNHVAFEACAVPSLPRGVSGKILYAELQEVGHVFH